MKCFLRIKVNAPCNFDFYCVVFLSHQTSWRLLFGVLDTNQPGSLLMNHQARWNRGAALPKRPYSIDCAILKSDFGPSLRAFLIEFHRIVHRVWSSIYLNSVTRKCNWYQRIRMYATWELQALYEDPRPPAVTEDESASQHPTSSSQVNLQPCTIFWCSFASTRSRLTKESSEQIRHSFWHSHARCFAEVRLKCW